MLTVAFDAPLKVQRCVFAASYLLHSNLNKESTTCGDPACDGLTIAIQGDILKANNVAFEGRPLNAKKSDKCEKIFRAEECAVPDTGKVGSVRASNEIEC